MPLMPFTPATQQALNQLCPILEAHVAHLNENPGFSGGYFTGPRGLFANIANGCATANNNSAKDYSYAEMSQLLFVELLNNDVMLDNHTFAF